MMIFFCHPPTTLNVNPIFLAIVSDYSAVITYTTYFRVQQIRVFPEVCL
jgi:hypothetical protein